MTTSTNIPPPLLRRPARWIARLLPMLGTLALLQTSVHAHHLPLGFEEVDEFEHSHAMLAGLQHPLTGWDHCLALLAIGGVAALSQRKRMLLPMMFAVGLVAGGFLGVKGLALPQAPFLAAMVLFAAGVSMILTKRYAQWMLMAATAAFAIWQGASHATLAVLPQTLTAYAAGFVISSAALMYAGGLAATLAQRLPARVPRFAGATLALAAVVSAAVHLS